MGIVAGLSLIVMAIAAGFSFGYAHTGLVTDSSVDTFQNLTANKSLFYAELAGWSLIFITDLIVAIALYFYFSNTSKQVATITALLRIGYTLLLGIAVFQLFKIIPLLSVTNSLSEAAKASETLSLLQQFEKLWSIGLIVFGLHLFGLGYLSVKSAFIHKLLGYLLYLSGISYIFIHAARQLNFLNPETIDSVENILALPMALAEMLLAFWLIYIGFRKSSPKIEL